MRPNRPVYLDNQATTPTDPRVLDAMLPWFTERFGNPHSAEHRMGTEAEAAVEAARADIAALIGAEPREIVLTSGATESNNIAIKGAARFARAADDPRRRIVTVATEHKCVLESVADLAAEGVEPVILPVEPDGRLDPARLADALATPTLLVSVMAVNNETGVVQDIAALAALAVLVLAGTAPGARAQTAAFPTRTVTIVVPFPPAGGADALARTLAPKLGEMWGQTVIVENRPGGQERGLRAGTLPTPLIVGLGTACRLAAAEMAADEARIAALRQRLLDGLTTPVALNGSWQHRVAGNLNITFDAPALDMLHRLPDLCVSTGSACSSAAVEPSYVLRALGLSDAAAQRTLRIGLGRFTSAADVDFAAQALSEAARALTATAGADA